MNNGTMEQWVQEWDVTGQGDLAEISLASMLEAEMSSREEPTIHPVPVFRPPPPAAHGPLDEGVIDVGALPDILMQALDDLGCLASPSCIPTSKKRKGVDRPVPPLPQKKSKVAYSRPGLPPPINRATKPKPHPTTWAGIACQAALMPPPPPGLGLQRRGPSPPPSFPMGHLHHPAYDGLLLVTPTVASPSDLDILHNFIRKSLPTGTLFEVALPSSTSFIKILDVPYFDPKGLKITQEALEKALRTSVHAEVFAYLSTKPRIDHNSEHSTSCTMYCNIWDSQQGTRAKKALGQPIFLAGQSCAIRPAARHTGVLLCQHCWKWGHPTVACKAKQLSCPICSGPHEQKEHRQHAGCCKGNAKAKPPVLPTPCDQPCPRKGCCVNCHNDHAANSASCKFWAHRYDREWIMNKYRQDRRLYLDELIAKARADPLTVLAATDGSVPQSNQYQAALAAIIYKGHHKLERTRYVSGRVTAPDAELNAISCAVRLAVKQANCQHIMVFTDSMGSAHRAVDPSVHSGQAFSLSVCRALQEWFEADDLRRITFVYIPSALR
ncbi:unnamed protein product [Cyclocybe aegerita]|uniref:Gag-like protein n=1 Tax=Cyclocybe aegerita TaxID=1973307 RepID=A0A8S0WAU6_CYCAE|nr:unnamed protein product [Cyclocybe aegerita]